MYKYCKYLYNFTIYPDCDKLQNDNHPMRHPLQILISEVEKAIHFLKNDKSLGNYNVSSEWFQRRWTDNN